MFQEIAYIYGSNHEDLVKNNDNKPRLSSSRSSASIERLSGLSNAKLSRKNSLVVGQKLRESKWFAHNEINIVCAVLESGFIIQKKDENTENERGIAVWTPGYEKSKNPDYVTIYTVCLQKGLYKVQSCNLLNFWVKGAQIRINNQSDQITNPNNEEIIKNQIVYAQNNKHKWHNSEHFTYWCRYGTPINYRKKKSVTDSLKWGNLGFSTGLFLMGNKKRTMSTSN